MPITNNDPLLGREATVVAIQSGGFMVRQQAGGSTPAQEVETFCANMDAVANLLALIYAPPT